jgi:bacterioferritin-associated ferredoxin
MRRRLLGGPGVVDRAVRQAAFRGDAVPASLAALVDKIRRHAYRVTDRDVAGAVAAGWTESQLFEVTVATAAGCGFHRLEVVDRLLAAHPGEGS